MKNPTKPHDQEDCAGECSLHARSAVVVDDDAAESEEHVRAIARGARWCYYVPTCANYDGHGFVPSLVVEGVAGHVPMMGRGAHAAPWYWGDDLEVAQRVCESVNARRGITPLQASIIVASSMRETNIGGHVRHS